MTDIAAYMNQATQTSRVIDGLPDGLALRPIAKVGIIGAGTMGGVLPPAMYFNIGKRKAG